MEGFFFICGIFNILCFDILIIFSYSFRGWDLFFGEGLYIFFRVGLFRLVGIRF